MSNFIQLCLTQQAAPEDIDDFIDQWHNNPGHLPLHEFLGMTREEYAAWIADASSLHAIIRARRYPAHSAPSGSPGGPAA